MITLQNFVKGVDGYTLLFTMGEKDTVDVLPTASKPFSPENYPTSVDYGVPAAGSVAINYFTQENFMFVNGEWGKDSVPSVLSQLTATENKVYVPDEGVDGYDKVTVNVPQLDTADATAVAGDILSGKTAYAKGAKVTGTIALADATATPTLEAQTLTPPAGTYYKKVTVAAAPIDEAKTVDAGTAPQTVDPVEGKLGIKSVTVNPTPSQTKSAVPTVTAQTIEPDAGKLLSSVEIAAAPLDDAQTVTAGTTAKTVSPTAGKLGIKSVTINPTPSHGLVAHPNEESQEFYPEDGTLFSDVTVSPIPDEYVVPTGIKDIIANGVTDVAGFESVNVAVPPYAQDVATAAAMDANLVAANVGKIYRFTGTTDANYTNGDLYIVEG